MFRFICVCAVGATVAALAQPASSESEVQQALHELLLQARSAADADLGRFLVADGPKTSSERRTVLTALQEFRRQLRPTADQPMSELSVPLLFVRAVTIEAPGRVAACAYITRVGSLNAVGLGAYEVLAEKSTSGGGKDAWRLVALTPVPVALFGTYPADPGTIVVIPQSASRTSADREGDPNPDRTGCAASGTCEPKPPETPAPARPAGRCR